MPSLATVPQTPAAHLRLYLYAAATELWLFLQRLNDDRHRFVDLYASEWRSRLGNRSDGDLSAAVEGSLVAWEGTLDIDLPLSAIGGDFTSYRQRLALMLAGWPEEDSRFGDLFAECQGHAALRRPTIETVGRILLGEDQSAGDSWSLCRRLVDAGLLEIENPESPRAEQALRPASVVWDALRGELPAAPFAGARWRDHSSCPRLEELLHTDALLSRIDRLPKLIDRDPATVVVLRHSAGTDVETVAAAMARRLRRSLLTVTLDSATASLPRGLGAVCTLAAAIPCFLYDLAPGDTVEMPPLPGYRGPIVVALGLEGGVRAPQHGAAITIDVPFPDPLLRERQWRAALENVAADALSTIRDRFQVPDGYIRVMAASASAQSALEGRDRVDVRDIRTAGRILNRQSLDTLAQWLEARGSWADLVATATTMSHLEELEQRCLHRERLADHVGAAHQKSVGRGVRALFAGASGTGKTMAARILAAELQMDLFRVDLSAIVSRFVGETEKNLHQVLSRAEALDVVLLIDEGDSLLGRRSETRSANDRWANLETNFLLQRLEAYQGIAIVTTNFAENIDPAFQRRMDVVVPFFAPRAEERRRIWTLHLPSSHTIDPDWLERVVTRCTLTGGQIRNAVLHAASLALEAGRAVDGGHVQNALLREYQKAGASYPLWGDGSYRRRGRGDLSELVSALRSR